MSLKLQQNRRRKLKKDAETTAHNLLAFVDKFIGVLYFLCDLFKGVSQHFYRPYYV